MNSPTFPKITIGDSKIDVSNAAKNLGVTIDKHLDVKDHVSIVALLLLPSMKSAGLVNTWTACQLNALSMHLCHQDLTVVTVFSTV